MRILLTLITLALLSSPAWAWGTVMMGGGVAAAATCTQNTDYSYTGTTDAYTNIGYATSNHYVGTTFNPASNISVCKVILQLTYVQGDISGKTYTVGIYSGVYGDALGTALGTATVTGSNSWSKTEVEFNFASAVSCTSGQNYRIVIYAGGIDTTNVARINVDETSPTWSYGLYCAYNTDKTNSSATSSMDCWVKIYGQ